MRVKQDARRIDCVSSSTPGTFQVMQQECGREKNPSLSFVVFLVFCKMFSIASQKTPAILAAQCFNQTKREKSNCMSLYTTIVYLQLLSFND